MKTLLKILLAIVGFSALISGILLLVRPDGSLIQLDKRLIDNTAFRNFFIPGLVLTLAVGGSSLLSLFYTITKNKKSYNSAIIASLLLLGFLGVEWLTIKASSWLQFFYGCIGFLILLIAYQLKYKWAV